MHEAKHIATSLTDSSHLSKDRKVMNNKGHLIPLLLGKVLCMPQDAKSCDVCSCMCIESVHESSSYRQGREGKKEKKKIRKIVMKSNASTISCTVWMKLHTFNLNQVGLLFKLIKKIHAWRELEFTNTACNPWKIQLVFKVLNHAENPAPKLSVWARFIRHVLLIYISSQRNQGLLQIPTSQRWGPERFCAHFCFIKGKD